MIYPVQDPVLLLATAFIVFVLILITHNRLMLQSDICPYFQRELLKSVLSQTSTGETDFGLFFVSVF